MSRIVLALLAGVAILFGVQHYRAEEEEEDRSSAALDAAATPTSEQAALSSCDGRTRCSQMTSCAEAAYFLQNCPEVRLTAITMACLAKTSGAETRNSSTSQRA